MILVKPTGYDITANSISSKNNLLVISESDLKSPVITLSVRKLDSVFIYALVTDNAITESASFRRACYDHIKRSIDKPGSNAKHIVFVETQGLAQLNSLYLTRHLVYSGLHQF